MFGLFVFDQLAPNDAEAPFHTPDWQFTADNNYRLCKDYNHLLVSQMIARANIQQDSCRTPCMDWHLDIHRLYELLSKRNLPIDQFLQLPSTPRIGKLVDSICVEATRATGLVWRV